MLEGISVRVLPAANSKLVSLLLPVKLRLPMDVTLAGSVTFPVKPASSKALDPIVSNPSGRLQLVILLQYLNAELEIVLIVSGSLIEVM